MNIQPEINNMLKGMNDILKIKIEGELPWLGVFYGYVFDKEKSLHSFNISCYCDLIKDIDKITLIIKNRLISIFGKNILKLSRIGPTDLKCQISAKNIDYIISILRLKGFYTSDTIKFISYDGAFPNLCSGTLTFELNGRVYKQDQVLSSGGRCYIDSEDNEVIKDGEWSVNNFANFTPNQMELITEMVNENISYGCCGGCI